ncbi:AAA family ATPase [Cylindrospermopsis raciborskii S07]|uniref:stress-responsive protein Ycf46 n=1 Tax=Cylindrospermopsis raciborskii TaxID=77022 RepID=UPI000C9E59A5|nr:AAA family ATPase [Cylindrospermopsis raciborskii]PNK01378.1 AAA family ATPase [Cylindrospermopsis raciborskii S10]PNK08434.1 AAA family ATPase [Cylindrospermopsis raciborskii S07]PNK12617.1 AAA family ATPase [Cylindrospermopsis raciborskii S06]PNK20531.1 AAA family ATPase [Cylindrospermopsis raciborskii S05]PNK21199.1 AAA family ATPase [Cylindrospermopsis raciborskii S01]
MKEELNILIQAQYPLIYLVTSEEERAEQAIYTMAQSLKSQRRVYVWTVTHGIVEYGQARSTNQHNTVSPEAAIEWAIRHKEPGIFIFKDLHPFIDAPATTRSLRDAIASFKGMQKNIILMSPMQQVPIELEKEVVVIDFQLPDMTELSKVLTTHQEQNRGRRLTTEAREKLLRAALGLTKDEAEKVYRKAQVTSGRLTEDEVDIVLSEKKQLIRRNGILEYIEEDETIEAVGGLEELKKWLKQRSNAFTERAREYGLPQPKGMLILGVPGCGKSLIAKTTSRLWGLPILRLDMGRVYDGSMVGRSEANLRNALKTAESISPTILFIDELDKSFAGSTGSSDSDGGTSSRIFGSFLTWMQEKKSPVFVMATANRVERLPGEFLRKGRFDEIFFVDLPTPEERQDIFRIHLTKRREEIARFDLEQLAKMSDGFSGAEIEQAIIAAMYEAFAQDREFTQLDIIAALKSTLPLSRTMQEQVTALRDWARQRARPAASSVAEYQRLEF